MTLWCQTPRLSGQPRTPFLNVNTYIAQNYELHWLSTLTTGHKKYSSYNYAACWPLRFPSRVIVFFSQVHWEWEQLFAVLSGVGDRETLCRHIGNIVTFIATPLSQCDHSQLNIILISQVRSIRRLSTIIVKSADMSRIYISLVLQVDNIGYHLLTICRCCRSGLYCVGRRIWRQDHEVVIEGEMWSTITTTTITTTAGLHWRVGGEGGWANLLSFCGCWRVGRGSFGILEN